MSTKGSASNLVQAAKELSNSWQRTQAHWRDAKSQEFEQNYLADLPAHVARATTVIAEIDLLLRKVRSECE